MYEVGTVCLKIAGRDAGCTCVVVDVLDGGLVLVDGETRRRKANLRHLEPTGKSVKIKKGASHEEVAKALGIEPRKSAPRKSAEKPKAPAKKKAAPKKAKKAPAKKAE